MKNRVFRFVFILLVASSNVLFAEDVYFDQIKFIGNSRIDERIIKKKLSSFPPKSTKQNINEDLKKIYSLGFFSNVEVSITNEAGVRYLNYILSEKNLLNEINFFGNDYFDNDDLSKIFNDIDNNFYNKRMILSKLTVLKQKYQSKGFLDIASNYDIENTDTGITLNVHINEGTRYKINKVSFTNSSFSNQELIQNIATRPYKWWNSWFFQTGRLSNLYLENDKELLKQFYLDKGYPKMEVVSADINKNADDELDINFNISEGDRYKISNVNITGDVLRKEKILKKLDVESDDYFSVSDIRNSSEIIAEDLANYGYAYSKIIPVPKFNEQTKEIDLSFQIEKGEPVYINSVNISGNHKTRDNVIRREVRIEEGDLFSGVLLRKTETKLKRSGYFDSVKVYPKNETYLNGKKQVDLNVKVEEGSTGSFSAGAGISSNDGVVFNSKLIEKNFLGTGRRVQISVDFGDQRDNFLVSLDDPRFMDTYWSTGISAFKNRRSFNDFDKNLTGANFSLGYPLERFFGAWSEDINFYLKYEYVKAKIDDVNPADAAPFVVDSVGSTTASSITPKFIRNKIDNPLNPSSGSRQILAYEQAGLGADEDFSIFHFKNSSFIPLIKKDWGEIVFAFRNSISISNSDAENPLPLYKRYFPGGINSVRGYKVRSMGPADANSNEYGGSKEFINNFEIIFPISKSSGLKGLFFFDIGDAFDDDESIKFDELKKSYGTGIRWLTPLGPLRIELGFPIDKEDGQDSSELMFSFGVPL